MKTLKKLVMAFSTSVVAIGSLLAVAPMAVSATSTAALTKTSSPAVCSQSFLTFPTWFRGLVQIQEAIPKTTPATYECAIAQPTDLGSFIWHIVLNVVEIGLQAVGYIAAAFILYGGFRFLTSAGDPQLAANARTTILNAVIGLGISVAAIAIVNLITGLWTYMP